MPITLARAALLGCATMLLAAALVRPAPADELRIGLIAPLTGSQAKAGRDMVNGFQMYLDQHKGRLGGAEVNFIVEDDEGKPDVAVAKARKLIHQDKVQIFIGGVLAATGTALAPVSTAEKTVYIASAPTADDLTQRRLQAFPYFIRSGWSASQPNHPFGRWACEQGYKKIVTIAADNNFGYEQVGGFQKSFEDCGGKIVQKIWAPVTTKDFGPFIRRIKADADAVFSLMVGPMAVAFPEQLHASGFDKPVLGGGTSYDAFALSTMGDEAIGDVSALPYSAALDTPKNRSFVVEYRDKYDNVPSYVAESSYTTAQMIDDVVKRSKGQWPGPEKFVAAMATLKIDAVRGYVSFDDMRNPIQNIYITKVEKKRMLGGDKAELWNSVIKTYPAVRQFWTYGKDAFLKQPAYSRDYPPCRYCE